MLTNTYYAGWNKCICFIVQSCATLFLPYGATSFFVLESLWMCYSNDKSLINKYVTKLLLAIGPWKCKHISSSVELRWSSFHLLSENQTLWRINQHSNSSKKRKRMSFSVLLTHLAVFLKDVKCAYQCGEGKFFSSDIKGNSHSM